MDVEQLIDDIVAIFPGASLDAIKAMRPIYHAHLDKYAGEPLRAAAEEVFGSYKSTRAEPFPKPFLFRDILSTRLSPEGKSIRPSLDERDRRKRANIEAWLAGQGRRIRESRHGHVYNACFGLAIGECHRLDWRYLTADQIALCERRALSQQRVERFGRIPKTSDAWWAQINEIAAEWGIVPDWGAWQEQVMEKENQKTV